MAPIFNATIGIDIGTTSVKSVLLGENGTIFAESEIQIDVNRVDSFSVEQDPNDWWIATCQSVRKIIKTTDSKFNLLGVGLSGQMHSSVFLDQKNEVIRPAILWNDVRTKSECEFINSNIGLDVLTRTVGNIAIEGFTAPKVLWLRNQEPNNYKKVRKLLLPKDFVRFKMTGEFVTEPSDAAGTLLFDIYQGKWSQEVLSKLSIDESILPSVINSCDVTGFISKQASVELGLTPGLPVFGGGGDNPSGAVASGVVSPGLIQVSIGTSGTLLTPIKDITNLGDSKLHHFSHVSDNLWYLMGVILSAGESVRWLKGILNSRNNYEDFVSSVNNVPVDSKDLFFLPYLSGERTPHNDPNARGCFIGLSSQHSSEDLIRAVIEGVCYAIRDSLELVKEHDVVLDDGVRLIGGASKSDVWKKILANILGQSVYSVNFNGGPSIGAAIIGLVGGGVFKSLDEAINHLVIITRETSPEDSNKNDFQERYEKYTRLYPILREWFSSS